MGGGATKIQRYKIKIAAALTMQSAVHVRLLSSISRVRIFVLKPATLNSPGETLPKLPVICTPAKTVSNSVYRRHKEVNLPGV